MNKTREQIAEELARRVKRIQLVLDIQTDEHIIKLSRKYLKSLVSDARQYLDMKHEEEK